MKFNDPHNPYFDMSHDFAIFRRCSIQISNNTKVFYRMKNVLKLYFFSLIKRFKEILSNIKLLKYEKTIVY